MDQHSLSHTRSHNWSRKINLRAGKTDRPDLIKTSKGHGEHEARKVLIILRHSKQQRPDEDFFLTLALRFKLAFDTASCGADAQQRLPQIGAQCPMGIRTSSVLDNEEEKITCKLTEEEASNCVSVPGDSVERKSQSVEAS